MSPSTVRSNEVPKKKDSATESDGTTAADENERIIKELTDEAESSSPATSRYGRAIKPKSSKNLEADTIQTAKVPKLRKSNQSSPVATEKSNGITRKETQTPIKKEPGAQDVENPIIEELPDADDISLSKNTETPECCFLEGQLAWAQVGNYPYWPCVITRDTTEQSYAKFRYFGKFTSILVHVQYFGDSCRHGWVAETSIIPFTGIADFYKLAENSTNAVKKKNGKFISLYSAKIAIKRKWDIAVDEATEVLPMTNEERAEHFKPRDEKSKYEKLLELATSVRGSKRERWSDSAGPNPKRIKRDEASMTVETELVERSKKEYQKVPSEDDEKISISLNTETPPTPPSSHKDSSDESTITKKDKIKKRKKDLDGDFELYYERNRDMIEDTRPDATESEIRTYLEKTWANMSLTLRCKYRSRIKPVSGEPSKEESLDQEDVSSIESDSSVKPKSDEKKKPSSGGHAKEPSTDQEDKSSVESDSRYNSKKPKSVKKKKMSNGLRTKEPSTDQEEESSVESEPRYSKRSRASKTEKEETRVSDTTKKPRPYNLFRGTKQERVCQICERTGDLTRCKGPCYSYFHLSCVKPGESSSECSMDEDMMEDSLFEDLKEIKRSLINLEDEKNDEILEDETFKCIDCLSGVAPACFICNEREEDRLRCSAAACGRHYHIVCLKAWPQSHWQGGRLTCPYHMCHTCNSDNPQNGISWCSNEKLVRCVRCPSSYHASNSCLPAGTEILTGSQIVCPKHYIAPGPPINATWCFLCTKGGSLICCDTCPTSFHPECLGIDAPDGAFICEDCETGRMPLYGEVVWVKLGCYRWWPSRICYPHEIPSNLEAIMHHHGEFCVMFLGTNNYYWVHRGRAFLYQDGDASAKVSVRRKNVDGAYQKALEEANEIHERLKLERSAAKGSELRVLRPPPYVKLKVNKPVGNVKPAEVESIGACDCDPKWDSPCAPDTDCLNRILSVECSPAICPAGPKCNNQAFVRRQYPAMEPFHTVGRGWGLRTLESITEGKFVVEYVGEVIDEAEYKRRLHHKKELKNENFYFLTIDQSRMIDAEPKGNLSRFMNHSCMPNCETQKWTVNGDTRIGLFALRDIEVGEELTFNYNLACDGETRKPCLCGAPNCSGFIGLKAQKQRGEEERKAPKEEVAIEKTPRVEKTSKTERVEKSSKYDKVEKTPRTDRAEKTSKFERVERTPISERIEKSRKSEKVEKTSKSERIEKTPKSERIDRTAKSEKVEKTPRSERVEKTSRSDKVEKTTRSERVEKTPRSERIEKAPKSEKVEKTPKSERVEKTPRSEKLEKTGKIEKVDKIVKTYRVDKGVKNEKVEKTTRSERLDKIVKTDRVDKNLRNERVEKIGKIDKTEKNVKTEKVEKYLNKRFKKMLDCWSCGETLPNSDDVLECDQKTCIKRYHRNCVTLDEEDSKFSCPWHHCKECGRRTSAHCTFCSTAYCQVHLDGYLLEYRDKTGYVCKLHEGMESRKTLNDDEDKEETDNETEADKDNSSISSDSLVYNEKISSLPRESSPRVAIVEVQFSSEEGEESQKEDSLILDNSLDGLESEKKKRVRVTRMNKSERASKRNKRHEERIKTLRSLTPSQLEIIIGGSIIIEHSGVREQL